jgi:hypothetical protein
MKEENYKHALERTDIGFSWDRSDEEWSSYNDSEKIVLNRRSINRLHRSSVLKWRALTAWIIVFSIAAISLYLANRHRITDVQDSRVYSCEKTYQSFPEMFRPFFPREQSDWTPEQVTNFNKLTTRANELAKRCRHQVSPSRKSEPSDHKNTKTIPNTTATK